MRAPQTILADLSDAIRLLGALRELVAPYEQQANGFRIELEAAMRASGAKTIEGVGLRATIAVRKDTKIVDPATVEAALFEMGALAACLNPPTLNTTAVKALAKERGEPFPGMEETETAYLTVKAVPS